MNMNQIIQPRSGEISIDWNIVTVITSHVVATSFQLSVKSPYSNGSGISKSGL
jgi:hypothetical protein